MKTLLVTTATLLLRSTAPAMTMSCCGGGKGKASMCGKGNMAVNYSSTNAKKGCCCGEGMSSNMSKHG